MADTSLLDAVERASMIFAGTVTKATGSSLSVLRARPGMAVVRLRRSLFQDPVLGDLEGRPVTVRLAEQGLGDRAVKPGEQLLFFATAWVHADEIAVAELGRLPDSDENQKEVVQLVESLPERHLAARVAAAAVIVQATVAKVASANVGHTGTEHDPFWMRAELKVSEVLKGEVKGRGQTVVLFFPGSRDHAFRDVPRPEPRQVAVFLLHEPQSPLPAPAYVAPDPADLQPTDELSRVRKLVDTSDGSVELG